MLKHLFYLPGYLVRFWMNILFVFGGHKSLGDAQRLVGANTQFGLVINSIAGWVGILALSLYLLGQHAPPPAAPPQPAAVAPQPEQQAPIMVQDGQAPGEQATAKASMEEPQPLIMETKMGEDAAKELAATANPAPGGEGAPSPAQPSASVPGQ